MTHIVLGYPSLEESRRIIDVMVECGVDLIEVQIPFSDPTADGPVITAACQASLDNGTRVSDAMDFMKSVSEAHPEVAFLFMGYVNVAFGYKRGEGEGGGLRAFVRDAAAAGASGLILPDLPPDQDHEGYVQACREHGLHPVYVISPNATDSRLDLIKESASGFVYSTSRTGTTGKEMELEFARLTEFLANAKSRLGLPISVGFSISKRADVEALSGHADVAVIGSHFIRVYEKDGVEGLKAAIREVTAV